MVVKDKQPQKLGNPEFGKYLADKREAAGLSRYELAERVGISYPYVSQLETGYRNPSAAVVQALSVALSVDAGEILALAFPPSMVKEAATMQMLRNTLARHPKLAAPEDKATIVSIDTDGPTMYLALSDKTTITLRVDRRVNAE